MYADNRFNHRGVQQISAKATVYHRFLTSQQHRNNQPVAITLHSDYCEGQRLDLSMTLDEAKDLAAQLASVIAATEKNQHQLEIKSLRDPIASCACGRWNYSGTATSQDADESLRSRIQDQFNLHQEAR